MSDFYDCGICGHWHPANWDGDCRDDANRYTSDDLDTRYGSDGWQEVETPRWTADNLQRFMPGGVTREHKAYSIDGRDGSERGGLTDVKA